MDENQSTILLHPLDGQDQLQNLQQTLSQLLSRNEFVDLTLCCHDGQVQAHRVVLALASTYIHNTLVTTNWPTPCSHPVLFFKTTTMEDMKTALKFIYTGRVHVEINRLPKIMNIARDLGCTYLVKAVEKAIQSCGIELFRQRVVQSSSSTPPTNATNARPSKVLRSDLESVGVSERETALPEQHLQLDVPVNSATDFQEQEQTHLPLSPKDIKTETTDENDDDLAIVMDNSMQSVGSNTTCSPGTGSTNNPGSVDLLFPGERHTSTESRKAHNAPTRPSINDMADFGDFDEHEDQLMNEEEDEQMSISVVDLKSLAEPVIEFNEPISLPFSSFGSNATSTEEQPASCPWCPQIFTSASLLQKHIRTHVGTYKPFACPYCSTSFARSAHLKRHIRTHTGEKPFICTVCDKAFSRQDKLKVHLERHMQTQPQGHQSPGSFGNNAVVTTTASSSVPHLIRPINKLDLHSRPKTFPSTNTPNQRLNVLERKTSNFNLMREPQPHFLLNPSSEHAEEQDNLQFMESGSNNVVHWHVKNDSTLALDGAGFNPILVSSASISPSTTITPVSSAPS